MKPFATWLRKIPSALLLMLLGLGAAHAAFLDVSRTVTTSNTPSCPVPDESGTIPLQADDEVFMVVTYDGATNVFDPGDWPANFTELAEVDVTLDGQSIAVAWKRLTGADTGTYTFQGSVGTSGPFIAQCISFRGRHATDPPVIASGTPDNAGHTTPFSLDSPSVTATCGDDLLWIAAPDVDTNNGGNGFTVPSGYTSRDEFESGFNNLAIATKLNAPAGATGTVSGSFALAAGTAGYWAAQIRIPAATACPSFICHPLTGRCGQAVQPVVSRADD